MRCLISKTIESAPVTPHDVFWVGVTFCTIGWVACAESHRGDLVHLTIWVATQCPGHECVCTSPLGTDSQPTTACLGKGGFPELAGKKCYGKINVEQEMRWWCPRDRHRHPASDRYLKIKQQKTDVLPSECLPGTQETREGGLSWTWSQHSYIAMPAPK